MRAGAWMCRQNGKADERDDPMAENGVWKRSVDEIRYEKYSRSIDAFVSLFYEKNDNSFFSCVIIFYYFQFFYLSKG